VSDLVVAGLELAMFFIVSRILRLPDRRRRVSAVRRDGAIRSGDRNNAWGRGGHREPRHACGMSGPST